MSECTDRKIGSLIHAYELGLLSEEENEAVEIHLLECAHCNAEFLELAESVRALRNDREIHETMEQLASKDRRQVESVDSEAERRPFYRRSVPLRVMLTAAAVLVFLLLKPWDLRITPDNPVIAHENAVAIMPFSFLAAKADTARIGDIVTNLLISDLSESRYLRVIEGENVLSLGRYLSGKEAGVDSATGEHDALERLGAKWALTGSILQTEPEIVISASLTDINNGTVLASIKEFSRSEDGIFSSVDKLSARIREELLSPHLLQDEFDPKLASVTTHSAEAYRWYLEGVELYGRKHFAEAEACYRKSVEYDSTFAMGWYCLAFHDVPDALEKAVKYSKRASQKEQLYINSLVASRAGDDVKAEELLAELVERYPNQKIAWMEMAAIARRHQRYSDAVFDLKQSLKADPLYVDALNSLAYLYNQMGEVELALAMVDTTIAIEPNEPNPYDSKGEILAFNGRLGEAIENYEKAIAIQPDFVNYETALRLGRLYIYHGDYDKAKAIIQTAVAGGGSGLRSYARASLAEIPLYQGKLKQAEAVLRDAFAADRLEDADRVNPGPSLHKYVLLSQAQVALNDTAGALQTLHEGVRVLAKASDDYRDRYSTYFACGLAQAGDDESARGVVERLRGKASGSGGSPDAVSLAEGFMAFGEGRYREALDHLKKVTNPSLTDFAWRYVTSRAYLELGQHDKAATRLAQTLSNYADVTRIENPLWAVDGYYYLALAAEKLGEKQRAAQGYEKFLGIWKDGDSTLTLIPEAEKRLAGVRGI